MNENSLVYLGSTLPDVACGVLISMRGAFACILHQCRAPITVRRGAKVAPFFPVIPPPPPPLPPLASLEPTLSLYLHLLCAQGTCARRLVTIFWSDRSHTISAKAVMGCLRLSLTTD